MWLNPRDVRKGLEGIKSLQEEETREKFRTLIAERSVVKQLYTSLENLGICFDYEGEIKSRGDIVVMRPPVELFNLKYSTDTLMINQLIDLEEVNYHMAIRSILNQIDWLTVKYFVAYIVDHKLLWGTA